MLETLGMFNSSLGVLNLPKYLVPGSLSRLHLLRDPVLRRLTCLSLPRDLISRRLSHFSLPADLHLDPGMPGSQAATVLGRIHFKKTHP